MPTTAFRLTPARYAADLSGEGARHFGGRWNERGVPALYTATSVALALIETLVHVGDRASFPNELTVTVLEINGELESIEALPLQRSVSQTIGTKLLKDPSCLGFWVPSVVVRNDRNIVLNPRCKHFYDQVSVRETFIQDIDQRLHV